MATLLDFNGVLVDDEELHWRSMAEVIAPKGITISEKDYFDHYFSFDDKGAFEAMLQNHGRTADVENIDELVQAKIPVYLRMAKESLRFFPGAPELLDRLASFGPIVIVSGALRHEIEMALDLLKRRQLVKAIVSAEDTPRSKPDPQGYNMGREILAQHCEPAVAQKALVVEDSPGGIQAAKEAGHPIVAVTHSLKKAPLVAAGADEVVDALAELDEALFRRLTGL